MLARRALARPRLVVRGIAHSASLPDRDIVIVGGGPVGLALAGALSTQETLSVALIEAGDLAKVADWNPPAEFSNRVVTLTNVSQNFLKSFGAWNYIRQERVNAVDEIQAWDGVSDSRIGFSGQQSDFDGGLTPMSWVTEVINIQHGLLASLRGQKHVELLDNLKVQAITRDAESEDGWPLVHLSDGRVLRARLLVGADGFNSPVRAFSGIDSYGWDYDRRGIVATLHHVPKYESLFSKANTTAYQRFLPTGPIAFLPLSPTTSSLVWSVPPHLASALQASEPQAVSHMVNAAFRLPELSLRYMYQLLLDGHRSGALPTADTILKELKWREEIHRIEPHSSFSATQDPEILVGIPPEDAHMVPPLVTAIERGSVASFPLRFQHAEAYIGAAQANRTCLIGDAAHTMNPLAGQGLNTGFADAQALARAIMDAVRAGGDVGALTALLPYARERYTANHIMLSAVDKLHKLYATTSPPIVAVRSAGLEVVNELSTVKDLIMGAAGSHPAATPPSNLGWNAIAQAIETAAGSASLASAFARGAGERLRSAMWN